MIAVTLGGVVLLSQLSAGASHLSHFGDLFDATIAVAQDAAASTAAPVAGKAPAPYQFILGSVQFFLLAFFVYFVLVLRPAQQKEENQRKFVDTLKPGDDVVTGGGVFGKVTQIKPEYITVEIASGVRVRVKPDYIFQSAGVSSGSSSISAATTNPSPKPTPIKKGK